MKESQAWRKLARIMDGKTKYSRYLCTNVQFNPNFKPGYDVVHEMRARIQENLAGDTFAYDETIPQKDQHQGRVLACLMFAQQAKDEERGVV